MNQRYFEYASYRLPSQHPVQSVTNSIPKEERPTVYFTQTDILITEGYNSIVREWIELAGSVNITAENGIEDMGVEITQEQLLKWDPDIIICMLPENQEDLLSNPTYQTLSAVKKQQSVY